MKNPIYSGLRRAFSLIEVIVVISVLGILAGLGMTMIGGGVQSGARTSKLNHDVAVLNSAVSSYLASGGNLSVASNPDQVLAKLKTVVSEESRRYLPGFSGSFIDRRAQFIMQTPAEAASNIPRALWNPETKKFEITNSGGLGIKLFTIDKIAPETEPESEDRALVLNYAKKSKWIWDYEDQVPVGPTLPGAIVLPVSTPPDSTPPPPPVPLGPVPVLQAPLFSIPGGSFPYFDFPLSLSITNPNPTGSSQITYSIDFGNWTDYSGSPISVDPDSIVKAQALPFDPSKWSSSGTTQGVYVSFSLKLERPVIEFSRDHFSESINFIDVSLDNPNPPDSSKLLYQIVPTPGSKGKATKFIDYSSPFTVNVLDYPEGFGVRAYAASAKEGYTDSAQVSRFATEVEGLFGGHLDLDTSDFLSEISTGSTSAHTHDITGKYGITSIDFFAIPDTKHINIDSVMPLNQRFKLTLVNGDLSPGLSIVIRYSEGGNSRIIDASADEYDDTKLSDLPTFTMSGIDGTARLESLEIDMGKDVIYGAGIIPTNTGEVKDNTLGREGEWRNGSLTVQAVAISSDGSDAFTTNSALSAGDHGAATSGLIWEGALFWHWDGDSYNESGNNYKAGNFGTINKLIEDWRVTSGR